MKSIITTNIFLTGFMGAGKTTVGKLLSDLLKCPFADIDEMITRREGCSITEIFAKNGEDYFRDCETNLLQKLPQQPTTVYATGGGLAVREENRRLMSNLGVTVYLHCPWTVLKRRLQQCHERPLVNSTNGWDEIRELWSQRQTFYECADIVINTDEQTPLQVAQKVVLELIP